MIHKSVNVRFLPIMAKLCRSMIAAIVLIVLVVNDVASAGSQKRSISDPTPALELVGHFGGEPDKVVLSGQTAYLASGPELTILDISSPSSPTRIGYALAPGMIHGLVVQGQTVYLAWSRADDILGQHYSGGVISYDVSDPTHPVEVSSETLPGGASGLALSGQNLYALWFTVMYNAHDSYTIGGLKVFDIASSQIVAVGKLADYSPHPTGIAIGNGYAYLITSNRLYTLDLANPAQPQPVRDDFWGGSGIVLSGNYAYVASSSVFSILNLTDPALPQQAGFLGGFAFLTDVKVQGHTAYVSETANFDSSSKTWVGGGLYTVDVISPTHPTKGSYFPIPYGSQGVDVQNHLIYVSAYRSGLRVLGPSLLTGLRQIGAYRAPGAVDRLAPDKQHIFTLTSNAVAGTSGLRAINISNQKFPVEDGSVGIEDGSGLVINGNLAYISTSRYTNMIGTNTLQVVDVSDPSRMRLLGSYVTTSDRNSFHRVAARDGYAYIAYDQSLVILDARNPGNISAAGQITASAGIVDVAIRGNILFIPDNGLRLFDVSDPANPTQVSSLTFSDSGFQIALWGQYAYVYGEQGLHIVDVSNSDQPFETGFVALSSATGNIAAEGGYVFLVRDYDGVLVVDATDPFSPFLTTSFAIPGLVEAIDIQMGYIYVAAYSSGLYSLRFNPLFREVFFPLIRK